MSMVYKSNCAISVNNDILPSLITMKGVLLKIFMNVKIRFANFISIVDLKTEICQKYIPSKMKRTFSTNLKFLAITSIRV